MLLLPVVSKKTMLFIVIDGVSLARGGIIGNPCGILSISIPPERNGICISIFNMMIAALSVLQVKVGWQGAGEPKREDSGVAREFVA